MIDELVKTGKFTEVEAKEFLLKSMQNGADETQLPKPNSQYR
jgi:polyhydroxyalkanoate synthesis regulator phasin